MKAPHASHYESLNPQPLHVTEAWGLGFHLGNVVKYVARAEIRGEPVRDLEKARFYLDRQIELWRRRDERSRMRRWADETVAWWRRTSAEVAALHPISRVSPASED